MNLLDSFGIILMLCWQLIPSTAATWGLFKTVSQKFQYSNKIMWIYLYCISNADDLGEDLS